MNGAPQAVLRTVVEGRLVVGAAAAAIAAVTASVLGVPLPLSLGAVIFAATVLIYDVDEMLDRRGGPAHVPPVVLTTALASAVVVGVALVHLRLATTLVVAAGLPVCAIYAVPMAFLGGARLKDHPLGKVGYVAAAVTVATVLLPCVEAGVTPRPAALAVAAAWVFLVVLGNAVACDLRDRARDVVAGPRTLAVVLGARTTRRLLVTAYLAALPLALGAAATGLVPAAAAIPVLATPVALHLLRDGAPAWAWGLLLDGVFLPMILFL